jgi:hypothetical protein
MGVKIENVNSRVLLLGDNRFEGGVISVEAGATIKAGTLLKRESGIVWAVVADTAGTPANPGTPASGGGWTAEPSPAIPGDVPSGLMPFDLTNDKGATASLGFRALVAGRVRADMCEVGGVRTTAEQNDLLRSVGILPVNVTDLSQPDNQ